MECAICGAHDRADCMTQLRLTDRMTEEVITWEYICYRCRDIIKKLTGTRKEED